MMKKIRAHGFVIVILVVSILISACAPLAPNGSYRPPVGGGGAAPAAEGGAVPSDEGSVAAAPAGESAAGDSVYRPRYETPFPARPDRTTQYEAVTAGVTDDNEEWQAYLDYLARNRRIYANQRDVSERYTITVVDDAGAAVHDATVEIYVDDVAIFHGRTDAGGQVLFHPLALDNQWQQQRSREYRVVATKGYAARSETFARYQNEQWTMTISEPERLPYAQLDLLFLIDATGSMGDEINKLKATMADIADQIALLPEQPDVRYGLVAYRDRGDAFVVRSYDFTPNLGEFQRSLSVLRADGGGDEPEALNEALHRSIHELSWRADDTVRLMILVADAPPHLDYRWENFSYDTDMIEAVRLGIKIFPVGASNLNQEGEYIFRQLAQFTRGKFVFLTYADGSNPRSGPGTETDHDVDTYSVDTLDRLVVRLVRDELAKLGSGPVKSGPVDSGQASGRQQPAPIPTPVPQPISCTIDLQRAWTDCLDDGAGPISLMYKSIDGRRLYQINLDPYRFPFDRVRFDITYDSQPVGYTVDIGDAFYTKGLTRGFGNRSNKAEVQVFDDQLQLFGNANTPQREALDGERLLYLVEDVVRAGETLSLEISSERMGLTYADGIDVVDSPYLFALAGQQDSMGPEDYTIYAAFNRVIDGKEGGSGVSKVVVTLYPARD